MEKNDAVVVVVIIAAMWVLTTVMAIWCSVEVVQRQALANGCAHYEMVDTWGGATKVFVWGKK